MDWSSERAFVNWVGKKGLACRPAYQIGLLGSAYFIGWCSTLLVFPLYADRHGRKEIVEKGMALNLIVYAVNMVTDSYWLTVLCQFVLGMLTSIRINVAFPYF